MTELFSQAGECPRDVIIDRILDNVDFVKKGVDQEAAGRRREEEEENLECWRYV